VKQKFKVFIEEGSSLREHATVMATTGCSGHSASGMRPTKNEGKTAIHKYRFLHVYDTAADEYQAICLEELNHATIKKNC